MFYQYTNAVHLWVFVMVFVKQCYIVKTDEIYTSCKNRKPSFTNVVASADAYSIVQCAALCMRSSCRSASFIQKENTCNIFADTYGEGACDSLETDSNSHFIYSKSPCEYDFPLVDGTCPSLYKDCSSPTSRVIDWIDIYPDDGRGKLRVWCYEEHLLAAAVPPGGWTPPFLNRTWSDYKYKFGAIDGSGNAVGGYWLGNENVYRITNTSRAYKLKYVFDLSPGDQYQAYYLDFHVSSEVDNYRIHFGSFTPERGVDELIGDGRPFRTVDYNDNGCAATEGIGFWYGTNCSTHPFNGFTSRNGQQESFSALWLEIVRD